MTTVTISGLTKRYGGAAAAVDDLSIEIGEGELVSLLGPSGCGKTTTLRSIAGFVEPDAGRILFDGVDITALPPERRNIGMVFQNYALFPHMTVRENLRFGLEMRRVPRNEMTDRIDQVLDTVQLAGLEGRYPRELSGGQQQRVGITTVYVTHDQAEAMVISDRIVVMFDGRIRQIGDATEIYAHPVSREVADFIGLSNFIDGRVTSRTDADYYLVNTPLGEVRCRSALALAAGDAAMVMVRPESIRLSREPPDDAGSNRIAGRVQDRFYLGNIAGYRVACGDGSVLQVQEEPWHAGAVGDAVWCVFPSDLAWIIRR